MRLIFSSLILLIFASCQEQEEISYEEFQIPNDLKIELLAHEPMIEAAVAMDFDEQGRMWVCEMKSYMPNIEGSGEDNPNGRIVILEDRNQDGKVDRSKVFLDKLILPRALLLAYGGLLYAEPPNLWFVEIHKDRPGIKTLVDSTYALKGNVEHQPNGLLLNDDNWIYNPASNARYRRKNRKWIKEYTFPRGQWGMTKDAIGRLVYNNNSTLLAGDLVLPNALFSNPYLRLESSHASLFTKDQTVYPIQATAVNRGYEKGVLDERGYLVTTTSACGPLIYQGSDLGEEYNGSAFVCLPEINAIKRLNISNEALKLKASHEESNKEFLITLDEGFRPVNLYNGPDGMYILDFHRGIIQHKAFMTSYLRDKLLKRGLNKVTGMGRIFKLSKKDSSQMDRTIDFEQYAIQYLKSKNVWLRDKAQRFIIQQNKTDFEEDLVKIIKGASSDASRIHALYSLEGLGLLTYDLLLDFLNSPADILSVHALDLMKEKLDEHGSRRSNEMISLLVEREKPILDLALCSSLNSLNVYNEDEYISVVENLIERNQYPELFAEAVLSDLAGKEDLALKINNATLSQKLQRVIQRKEENKKVYYYQGNIKLEDRRTVGMGLYQTYCASCHGRDGEGVQLLAPPLLDSEFVSGPDEGLILITLHGMKGPLTVNKVDYTFNAMMPGIKDNTDLSDEDIKDILHFVRNAFASAPYSISEEKIKELRNHPAPDAGLYTVESLAFKVKELTEE